MKLQFWIFLLVATDETRKKCIFLLLLFHYYFFHNTKNEEHVVLLCDTCGKKGHWHWILRSKTPCSRMTLFFDNYFKVSCFSILSFCGKKWDLSWIRQVSLGQFLLKINIFRKFRAYCKATYYRPVTLIHSILFHTNDWR